MIRKRGIIATVIYISILVNAIPLVSSLCDIYNEPLDLDSPLVFNDERRSPRDEDVGFSSSKEEKSNEEPEEILEATEVVDYGVYFSAENRQSEIEISQKDFDILVSGKLDKRENNQNNSLSFDFYGPDNISEEMIRLASVRLVSVDKSITQKKDNFVKRSKKGKSYFTLTLEINNKKSIPVEVDWGDGFVLTYLFKFDVENFS